MSVRLRPKSISSCSITRPPAFRTVKVFSAFPAWMSREGPLPLPSSKPSPFILKYIQALRQGQDPGSYGHQDHRVAISFTLRSCAPEPQSSSSRQSLGNTIKVVCVKSCLGIFGNAALSPLTFGNKDGTSDRTLSSGNFAISVDRLSSLSSLRPDRLVARDPAKPSTEKSYNAFQKGESL
jgi:hypothetical protein